MTKASWLEVGLLVHELHRHALGEIPPTCATHQIEKTVGQIIYMYMWVHMLTVYICQTCNRRQMLPGCSRMLCIPMQQATGVKADSSR